MKKFILTLSIMIVASGIVLADGNAFTPLNFNDTQYSGSSTSSSSGATVVKNTNSYDDIDMEAIGNENIQSAIQQLDNAQMDIRNDLLNLKTKYADVDAQYKLIKNERNTLKRQITNIERRIKDIDRAKEKIRQNML